MAAGGDNREGSGLVGSEKGVGVGLSPLPEVTQAPNRSNKTTIVRVMLKPPEGRGNMRLTARA